ncbi:MAG: ABC transporter transmembrane domain-containing protein [Alphaproteobacteria bacterium]
MDTTPPIPDVIAAAMPAVRRRPLRKMPKRLYGYVLRTTSGQQIGLCLLTVLSFPLTLGPLELQRRIIDGAIKADDLDLLLFLGGLYFAVVVMHGALKFVTNFYTDRVAEGVTRQLRRRIVHNDAFASEADEGTRQSIIAAESEKVGGFVAESIAFPLLQVGVVLSVLGYMLVVEPLMAAVAMVFVVPSVIVVWLSQPVLNRLSGEKISTTRELAEEVLDTESEDEDEEADAPATNALTERIYRLRLRFAWIKHATKGLNNLFARLGPLSILLVGGWMVIEGRTEVGTIVAFISGFERMTGPGRDLLNFYRRLAMMRVQYRLITDAGG